MLDRYWSVKVTVYKINLHTWFIGVVVLNVMVPQPYFFPLLFEVGHGNLTILEFSFK